MKNTLKYIIGLPLSTVLSTVVVYPVQAQIFLGSLAFSDGTNDWFNELSPGVGDTFNVEFNPLDLNFVSTATGVFAPPLFNPPIESITSSTGTFEFVEFNGSDFIYQLTNNLNFAFNNGVTISYLADSSFLGRFNDPGAVEFQELSTSISVTGLEENVSILADTLIFSDSNASGGGTYNSQIDVESVPVPEPSTVIGLGVLTSFGIGTGFKHKLAKTRKK